jgi:1,2-diacylglycerol 3-alpha-glucosyltransferase
MRILYVSDVYFPRVNGVSTSIRTFRDDLSTCGIETVLVVPDYHASGPEEPGVIRVAADAVWRDPEDRRMRWTELTRILDALPAGLVDMVHIHTPFLAHYAGARFARRANIPCVATYHTFFEEYLHHYIPMLPRPVGRVLARALTRSQCADVQALIAPSDPMEEVLRQYGVSTPVYVLPTGIAADRFIPGDAARFRAIAGLPSDRPLVTYIGRVAHEKNIDFLVNSFVEVRRTLPAAMLVIAGEGPARDALRQLVAHLGLQSDVHFAGNLDRDTALLDCYAAADVFVFASRTETQGLVLLEAMAQGAPIVSTAKLGAGYVLRPASGALIVDELEQPFAEAVVRLLRDPALRRQMSEQGRTFARTWASAVMARRLADVYRSISLDRQTVRAAA